MEGLLFLIILVVASLLRGKARQGRQPPPPRPRRPVLDPEGEESREDTDFFPPERPARKRVLFDDTLYKFGREPARPRARREKPPEVKDPEIKAPGRVKPAALRFPQAGQGKLQNLFFEDREELARGIILTEVLGPPLSKRKKRGFV